MPVVRRQSLRKTLQRAREERSTERCPSPDVIEVHRSKTMAEAAIRGVCLVPQRRAGIRLFPYWKIRSSLAIPRILLDALTAPGAIVAGSEVKNRKPAPSLCADSVAFETKQLSGPAAPRRHHRVSGRTRRGTAYAGTAHAPSAA